MLRTIKSFFAEHLSFFFTAPALLWQTLFVFIPFLLLVLHSVVDYSEAAGYFLTFGYYAEIINSLYLRIILRSFVLAAFTASCCLLIAYPVAYYFTMFSSKRYRPLLLFSIILPSWTSLIVQVYAWFFLLERNGIISRFLRWTGLLHNSVSLLNNYFSILLGMVSCYLPFMILPIYAVLEKMDKKLLEASADLGADKRETFKRVIFPMSLPGVYAGWFLVFIPSFGEFAVPSLLGGSKYLFWGSVIVDKFLKSRDWRVGGALTIVGILVPVIIGGMIVLVRKIHEWRAAVAARKYLEAEVRDSWN